MSYQAFVGGRRFRAWEAAVFGAAHVERALAFRWLLGNQLSVGLRKVASAVWLSRLVHG